MTKLLTRFANLPTPMAGLALGIGSLGWSWENSGLFSGEAQIAGAIIAGAMLALLAIKFVAHPKILMAELAHPVVGSVVPTFAMATMVVSKAMGGTPGTALWLFAIALHLTFLGVFVWHRSKNFELNHMVPSWFVPPIGIIVADVCSPGGAFTPLAHALLYFGMACYTVMLPIMIYRLIFGSEVPDAAKPTIAIMAAPASLSLAGYLTVVKEPTMLTVAVLLGIAILMTTFVYLAFIKLMRLPFSPAYAAFTFPLVIGATALFKTIAQVKIWGVDAASITQLQWIANLELVIATVVVGYVALRYTAAFCPRLKQKQPA